MTADTNEGAAGPWASRTLVLLNPAAGQDDPVRLRRTIGGAFAARSADFDLRETQHAGHASALAREAAGTGYQRVCVVGGDGTIAEAATGLVGTDVPLAIIPRGTANQVALNLGIPTDVEAAIEVAVNGTALPIDLGRIEGRNFALVAGAGFDAAVMAAATRELKEKWGFGAYVYAAVKEALNAAPVRFNLVADGQLLEVDAVTVMVANVGELFAGFLPLRLPLAPRSPISAWQDGMLDVVVVGPRKLPDVAAVIWNAAHKRFGVDSRLLHFQVREITIDSPDAVPVQIDGDPAGHTPVRAQVVQRAIRIMMPA